MKLNLNNMISDLNHLSQYIESKLDIAEEKARKGHSMSDEELCLCSYAGVLDTLKEYLEVEQEKKRFEQRNNRQKNKKNKKERSGNRRKERNFYS